MARRSIGTALSMGMLILTLGAALALSPSSKPGAPSEPTTPGAPPTFPMKLDTFLAGSYLDRADVVLTRRDWDLSSWVIRWATNSPFSHAALVFNRPGQEPGIVNTFVIEAGTGGVDLTNLRDYASDKSSFIAIKRFRGTWFNEDKQARVRGVLLDKIKASYNFWTIGRIASSIWFGVQSRLQSEDERSGQREKTLKKYKDREWTPPSEFICSGLVQIGFVEAVLEYVRKGELPPSALKDVVFINRAEQRIENDPAAQRPTPAVAKRSTDLLDPDSLTALESVTPDDLAKSRKLEWLYVIKGDEVHQVRTLAQVMALLEK